MSDLFGRDRVGYLDQTQSVYYSRSAALAADIQIRIVDTGNPQPDAVLLQPEQALKLLSWLEKERATLEALARGVSSDE